MFLLFVLLCFVCICLFVFDNHRLKIVVHVLKWGLASNLPSCLSHTVNPGRPSNVCLLINARFKTFLM